MTKAQRDDGLEIRAVGTWHRMPGARVEKLSNRKTGHEGEIRLDKSTMTFYGVALDEVAESKDGAKVREWVNTQLARADAFDWQPVIRVKYTAPERDYDFSGGRKRSGDPQTFTDAKATEVEIEVQATRFYIALGPSGRWRRISWEKYNTPSPEMQDFDQGSFRDGKTFALPWTDRLHRYGRNEETIVAYSDETWTGLLTLITMLKDGRQRILDLMRQDADLATFAQVGAGKLQNLLTAGSSAGDA